MIQLPKIEPNYGYTVLKPLSEGEVKRGNIIIPDMGKEKPQTGIILEIADTYNFNTGEMVPSKFKVGDTVFYPAMSGKKINYEEETYIIVGNQDLISRIRE